MKTGLILSLLLAVTNVGFCYQGYTVYYDGYIFVAYRGGEDTVTFSSAQNYCPIKLAESTLAMAKNSGLNKAIQDTTDPYYYPHWIGGHDLHGEGFWKWVDSTQITWSNWYPGEPNNHREEDCLGINHDAAGKWADFKCGEHTLGYVCQVAQNKIQPYHYSELVFSDSLYGAMKIPVNYWDAKARCAALGSRLVQVKDGKSTGILREKLKHNGMEYWVELKSGDDHCTVLNRDGSETRNCNDVGLGFICESEIANNVEVTDHHPVVAESGNLRLECTASGFPLPDVAWFRDEKLVSGQSIGVARSTLVINNASEESSGYYYCHATNTIDEVEHLARSFIEVTVTA